MTEETDMTENRRMRRARGLRTAIGAGALAAVTALTLTAGGDNGDPVTPTSRRTEFASSSLQEDSAVVTAEYRRAERWASAQDPSRGCRAWIERNREGHLEVLGACFPGTDWDRETSEGTEGTGGGAAGSW
jgi:hypothetical protein